MPTQKPKKLTLIELLVIVAMVTILAGIVIPAMHVSKRRAAAASPSAVTPRDLPSEGQFNTIDPPQTARETPRFPALARKPGSGWLFQLVLAGVIIKIIRSLRARKTPPLHRKPEHQHPPDADP